MNEYKSLTSGILSCYNTHRVTEACKNVLSMGYRGRREGDVSSVFVYDVHTKNPSYARTAHNFTGGFLLQLKSVMTKSFHAISK